jgi:hypothetical protein
VIAGTAIVLSNEDGKGLLNATLDYRRQVEISAGSFELGEWPEFAKRYACCCGPSPVRFCSLTLW